MPPQLTWQMFADGTLHIRITCAICGSFGGYARRTPETVYAAGDEVLTTRAAVTVVRHRAAAGRSPDL